MGFLQNNFISDFFYWVIQNLTRIMTVDPANPPYLLSIVIIVILIRLAMIPLDIRQRSSSYKMGQLSGRINDIKKRYPDQQMQQKKINELYQKEGVKPLAGCLPLLIQMPIFFAFYGALRTIADEQTIMLVAEAAKSTAQSINLPSFLWIHNIWQPDSALAKVMPTLDEFNNIVKQVPQFASQVAGVDYAKVIAPTLAKFEGMGNGWFILAVIQAVTMYFSQVLTMRQNPGMQQGGKVMLYIFPLFSAYICVVSNSVFAVYWLISNVYAIIQTLVLKRYFEAKHGKIDLPAQT